MNRYGFSLVELIVVITLIAIVVILVLNFSGNTLSITEEYVDSITYDNVVKASKNYVLECESNLLECNYIWNDKKTSFSAIYLVDAGYFKEIKNNQNQDISNCLIINVDKSNNSYKINLDDSNCK